MRCSFATIPHVAASILQPLHSRGCAKNSPHHSHTFSFASATFSFLWSLPQFGSLGGVGPPGAAGKSDIGKMSTGFRKIQKILMMCPCLGLPCHRKICLISVTKPICPRTVAQATNLSSHGTFCESKFLDSLKSKKRQSQDLRS